MGNVCESKKNYNVLFSFFFLKIYTRSDYLLPSQTNPENLRDKDIYR